MFASPRGGNLHPSVVNKSPGLGNIPSGLSPGANSGIQRQGVPASSGGVDIDEAEARMRAREILQDFVRQKHRTQDTESQLQRAVHETERLSHTVEEQRVSIGLEKERHMREISSLKADRSDIEARIESSQEEVNRVAKAAAQRASDAAAHLRVKEREIDTLEGELVSARDEIHKLRTELLRVKDKSHTDEEVGKAQQKVVELARKLLDAERSKNAVEKELINDRKHLQQSVVTIENLRKQLAAADEQRAALEKQKDNDKEDFQKTVVGAHLEMELQREMYKQFMGQISDGTTFKSAELDRQVADKSVELSVAETKLAAAAESKVILERQVAAMSEDVSKANKALMLEQAKRIEDAGNMQTEVHRMELSLKAERDRAEEVAKTATHEHEQLVQLIGVHDAVKQDLEATQLKFATAAENLRELTSIHEALREELGVLREEAKAKDSGIAQLKEALQTRTNAEARIREMQILHNHEKEMMRLQLSKAGAGGSPGGHRFSFSGSYEDTDRLQHKLTMLEAEKDRLEAERSSVVHVTEHEKASMVSELRAAKEALEQTKIENAQLRSQALHAQREVEEWRSAFHMSERAKHKLQAQLDDTRDVAHTSLQDRNAVDARMQLLQQHVDRLEAQAERDMQELHRVRREYANLELDIAQKDLAKKDEELTKLQGTRPTDPNGQLQREKDLVSLRTEKERKEKEVRQKELNAQQLHEAQLRAMSHSPRRSEISSTVTLDKDNYDALMAAAASPPVKAA